MYLIINAAHDAVCTCTYMYMYAHVHIQLYVYMYFCVQTYIHLSHYKISGVQYLGRYPRSEEMVAKWFPTTLFPPRVKTEKSPVTPRFMKLMAEPWG